MLVTKEETGDKRLDSIVGDHDWTRSDLTLKQTGFGLACFALLSLSLT